MEPFVSKLRNRWSTLSSLQQRITTAAVLAPVFLVSIYLGGLMFSTVLIAMAVVGYREWLKLVQTDWPKMLELAVYAGMALAILVCALTTFKLGFIILFLTAAAVAVITHLYLDRGKKDAPPWLVGGVFYIGVPMLCLQSFQPDWTMIVTLFGIVWATDSFAYFAGRKFGGPKLAPTISPNKTWSGLIGGAAGAAMTGLFLALIFGLPGAGWYFFFGALLAVVAQGGDLFESFVKRRAGVKDSGTIIPGHGGLLDRIDGVLTASPVFMLMINALV